MGNAGANMFNGTAGDDVAVGLGGDDALRGFAGADRLDGGVGNDFLDGGDGAGILIGGGGLDTLNGGAGNGVFKFNATSDSGFASRDQIVSFQGAGAAVGDRIDLSAIDAKELVAGDQAFTFKSTGTGGLFFGTSGTETIVFCNTDADAMPEFAIRILDGAFLASAYTAADFIL